ncbi:hypothetical protein Btru_045712 [Bulinus truncatus]|nr:hypothetical protein Btru_045712 [Bulinus truncatus]
MDEMNSLSVTGRSIVTSPFSCCVPSMVLYVPGANNNHLYMLWAAKWFPGDSLSPKTLFDAPEPHDFVFSCKNVRGSGSVGCVVEVCTGSATTTSSLLTSPYIPLLPSFDWVFRSSSSKSIASSEVQLLQLQPQQPIKF